jgi:ATP-dependent Clp protease ATP-binding subunit ClpC
MWLIWLIVSRLFWNLITLGFGAIALATVLTALWSNQMSWTELADSHWVAGFVVVFIVWLYWGNRLKGQKPHLNPGCQYFNYFSYQGRQLFWQALLKFYQAKTAALTTGQLLSALMAPSGSKVILARLDLSWEQIQSAIANESIPFEQFLQTATESAVQERSHISWEDMLRAVIRVSPGFKRLLEDRKITVDEAVAVVNWTRDELYRKSMVSFQFHSGLKELLRPKRNLNKDWTSRPTPVLDQYSQNLTDLAKLGMLTSAKVRTQEVEEGIRILSRSDRNNLVLVGEPGVGKTSVVGDLALRIIQGQIPALDDFKLMALDIGAMIASKIGFDKLFAAALNEAANSGNCILFVGNIDQLSKSKTTEGFDIASVLISALDKPGLQIIATSDPVNYKKYIENNETLSEKFARLDIEELDGPRAILVLEDLSYQIESRQGVLVTLAAIKTAVSLSQKLIHASKLPDKAMDLLDEAAILASRQGRHRIEIADIEQVVSTKTNVPVGNVSMEEREKLSNLEEKIHSRMIGQDEAVTAVSEALKRARMEVSASAKRPIGTFMFLGPTGVGKTELAKSLAWAYFGDDTKMIRLDMSEFQTADSISRLLGAPVTAGDVSLSGGSFTEAVKAMPFAVVLLDEIEKAHPDILNVFLQVLDEGRLTDNLGHTVDFTNTIIIATSNAQARFIEESVRTNQTYETIQKQMRELLVQESFRPEFINRFDGVIIFKPLTSDQILEIAKLKVAKLQKYLSETKHLELAITDNAMAILSQQGYDPAFGARPLERTIRDKVETKVANALLVNPDTKTVTIDATDLLS